MKSLFENEELLKGSIGKRGYDFVGSIATLKKPKKSLEIGVASGIGSRAILDNSNSVLHGIDTSREFFLNPSYSTGELVLDNPRFTLNIGTSGNLKEWNLFSSEKADFVFIDAVHKHPWPAVDLWNVMVTDSVNYPFTLVLDDIGLFLAYIGTQSPSGLTEKGPNILFNCLSPICDFILSPTEYIHQHPNLAAVIIEKPNQIQRAVTHSLSFTPEDPNAFSMMLK